jgi:predicted 3-demethylubiquinone-9 3-methyltransferase (glyoxalase superfamily)
MDFLFQVSVKIGIKSCQASRKKNTPSLWFDHQAEDTANFYVSIFKNSRILNIGRYIKSGPGPEGA